MQVTVEAGNVSGTIAVPPSKSMTQRAYAGALLHKGTTIIHNAGVSDDENAALAIILQLGAKVTQPGSVLHIESAGVIDVPHLAINCGESGLAARLFAPIAALSDREIKIDGHGSLLQRPMEMTAAGMEVAKVRPTFRPR